MRAPLRVSIVAALVLAGVACGADGPPPPCDARGATKTVDLQDFAFAPACIEAASGATVALTNSGETPHSFTVKGTDASADVDAGESGGVSLAGVEAGTYAVMCVYHPQMSATLNVI